MNATFSRRNFVQLIGTGALAALTGGSIIGCSASSGNATSTIDASTLAIDNAKWSYDDDNDVYYQIGLPYCVNPVATDYESYGIYVPGKYFDGVENADGTFTCTVNESGAVGDFTAKTAPIVMPINTAGYSAQEAPTGYSYDSLADYLEAGMIYVYAGCRGRANSYDDDGNLEYAGGAPWGVTDLKAAVRTIRYNASSLPGDSDAFFSLGMSGGGAQSAVLGATGDAEGYSIYLDNIGAPTTDAEGNTISDALMGSMCWCPITNLDLGSEAYEWNIGQFSDGDTRADGTFTRQMSQDMAAQFASYVNELGLVDANGNKLTLEEGGEGIYTAGSYYDYIVSEVERSLNNFLADTEFPYTPSNDFNADMGAGGGMGGGTQGGSSGKELKGGLPDGEAPSGDLPDGEAPSDDKELRGAGNLGSSSSDTSDTSDSSDSSSSETTTYETAKAYIAHLNEDETWIEYDESKNTATITGLSGFINACKQPTKNVGAYDAFDLSNGENQLFGTSADDTSHFDAVMAQLLTDNADTYAALENWDASYPSDYTDALATTDDLGCDIATRSNIYNPLYYLCDYYDGYQTSTPSKHWRIRTGIEQGDAPSTTEINLALALQSYLGADNVDFETVWGQGHTMAERTGSSTENFIEWVKECCK